MKYSIALIDAVFLLALLAAFFILIARRKKHLQFDIRLILTALLTVNVLYGLCLFLEWAGITNFLETYEDLIGAMVPMIWAFFFYAVLQNIAGTDLKKSEDRYRRLFEGSNDLIVIHQLGKIIDVNQKMCDVLGYSRNQLLNMSIPDLHYHDESRDISIERVENIKDYSDKILEGSLVKANGDILYVEVSTSTVDLEKGIGQGILRDITERKKAEEILKESEEKYRLLAEYANDVIFTLDLDLKYTYVSPSHERLRGYRSEEVIGRGIDMILTPESQKVVRKLFEEVSSQISQKTEGFTNFRKIELETCHRDGSVIWCEVVLSFIYNRENKPVGILGVARDISERKKAERELRNSEEKFSKVFHSSPDSITLSSLEEGKMLEINSGSEKIFGHTREEALGRTSFELGIWADPGDREKIVSELKEKGMVRDMEIDLLKKTGERITCQFSADLIEIDNREYVMIIARDITEKKLAEDEKKLLEHKLRQTQKMEAIGTLAGGIAHDFNNILSIIFGFTELALMDIDSPEKVTNDLDELKKAALRAKELIKQILTISRQTEQEKQPIRITPIVSEAMKLLRSTIPTSIEINSDIVSHSTVLADATQVHQIIMNLCTNAYHAMGDGGGILGVSVKDIDVSDNEIVAGGYISPGKYVRIEVRDTGHGMNEKIRERIFEPYFTTKKLGEGTGLGLAVVHGIVESHGGVIKVYSERGVGTSFQVYLPVFEGEPAVIETQNQIQYNMKGTERILFVDDEKIITDIAEDALSRYGYKVRIFHSSINALDEFRKTPSDYDLIITDMTMPGMNGLDLVEKVREIRPDMPVILCSGYNKLLNLQKTKEMGVQFINKPIIISDMIRSIRLIFEKGEDAR